MKPRIAYITPDTISLAVGHTNNDDGMGEYGPTHCGMVTHRQQKLGRHWFV